MLICNNRWLDTTPTSRVIARYAFETELSHSFLITEFMYRCTEDIRAGIYFNYLTKDSSIWPFSLVDGPIADGFSWVAELTLVLVTKFSAVVIITPIFLIPGLVMFFIGGLCGQIYMKAQLSVKREMSNSKAPVLAQWAFGSSETCYLRPLISSNASFGAAITGISDLHPLNC